MVSEKSSKRKVMNAEERSWSHRRWWSAGQEEEEEEVVEEEVVEEAINRQIDHSSFIRVKETRHRLPSVSQSLLRFQNAIWPPHTFQFNCNHFNPIIFWLSLIIFGDFWSFLFCLGHFFVNFGHFSVNFYRRFGHFLFVSWS